MYGIDDITLIPVSPCIPTMDSKNQQEKQEEVIPGARNQKEEVQALQDTIYVLGGKWRIPIINSICNGNTRFRDIERSIPGITTRMLSRELKDMEANQLIRRTVKPTIPVTIEYTSTEYCQSFGDIIMEMIKWGKSHRERVIGSRQ
jgi:DNA-binding HxlR family transcriptional regulator